MSARSIEHIIEVALLIVVALPLARLSIDPGIRRRFQAFPPMQALMVGSLVIYAAGILAVIAVGPVLLRPAAAIALILILLERWQARSSYGKSRGFPPGSLAVLPAQAWKDPEYYKKASERYGHVFKFRHFQHPAIGIVGLERAADFLRANDESLVVPPAPFNELVAGGFVRYLDGVQHEDVAGLLRSAFTQSVVEASDAAFSAESRLALDRMAANNSGVDPMPVIDRMVLNEMMTCFLGIAPGPVLDRLEQLFHVADYRRLAHVGRERAGRAVYDVVGVIRTTAADGAREPGAPRSFLSELTQNHPDAIASDAVVGNFAYTLHTARLDVNGMLMWLLATLGGNQTWQVKLRAALCSDREGTMRSGGLADRIVRETLRLHQSEFLLRRVTSPIEWGGFRIPAGWHVRICVGESHRLPEMFEQPEVFDPDRFLQPPNRTRYSPFGLSPRLCPGEHLARAMGRHLAAELVSRYDCEVFDVEPQEFSGFHWRPGPHFRVALTPLA